MATVDDGHIHEYRHMTDAEVDVFNEFVAARSIFGELHVSGRFAEAVEQCEPLHIVCVRCFDAACYWVAAFTSIGTLPEVLDFS